MITLFAFAFLMIVLRQLCLRIQPGKLRTLAIISAATVVVPAALFALRVAVAYVDSGVMTPNEHVASAFVQAFVAMIATPFFAAFFRYRARVAKIEA